MAQSAFWQVVFLRGDNEGSNNEVLAWSALIMRFSSCQPRSPLSSR